MVIPITAAASAGPEDVLRPRFWADQTINARGRVLLDNGDSVQGAGVTFLFRLVSDRTVQIELPGIWDAAAQCWRCPVVLGRIGAWEMRMVCQAPQRQTDWMTLDVVATPGTGAAPGGGLWVSQQDHVLMTMSGAGLTGARIADLLLATDPAGVTLPGVAADGSDVRVPWALLEGSVQDAAAEAVAGQLAGKADVSALQEVAGRVDRKADASALQTVADRVDRKADASTVQSIADRVAGKADAGAVADVVDRLTRKADASVLQGVADAVARKADAGDVVRQLAGKADADQVALVTGELSGRLTAIETAEPGTAPAPLTALAIAKALGLPVLDFSDPRNSALLSL